MILDGTAYVPVDRPQGPGEPVPFVDMEDIPSAPLPQK